MASWLNLFWDFSTNFRNFFKLLVADFLFWSGTCNCPPHTFYNTFFGTEFRPLLLPISGDLSLGVPKPTFVEVWMELEEKLSSLKVGLTDCE